MSSCIAYWLRSAPSQFQRVATLSSTFRSWTNLRCAKVTSGQHAAFVVLQTTNSSYLNVGDLGVAHLVQIRYQLLNELWLRDHAGITNIL